MPAGVYWPTVAFTLPPRRLRVVIDRTELQQACLRLTPQQAADVMRERYLPLPGSPRRAAIADERAADAAEAAGFEATARVGAGQLVQALIAIHGRRLIEQVTNDLARRLPSLSASRRLTAQQALAGLGLLGFGLMGLLFAPGLLGFLLAGVFTLLFLAVAGLKVVSMLPPPRGAGEPTPPPLPEALLPAYTVMVPLFREIAVVDRLIEALLALDYPADRLDVKLVLEESDLPMRRHMAAVDLPAHFEIITVPQGGPQTKPKALDFALRFARGDLIVIYDAEDRPHPMQLRRAAALFAISPPDLVCVQARLAFYNAQENWLTRQFAIEYATLFDLTLPMLSRFGLPLPLGGTSNHFRTRALRRLGAWDPYNVTEDADLGLRLARLGYRTTVIASTTLEEANCRLGNWLSQRARWLKGWILTWLVHMRSPSRLWDELGPAGFLVVQVMLAGMIVSVLGHPLFMGFTLWSLVAWSLSAPDPSPWAAIGVGMSVAVLVIGYGCAMLSGLQALKARKLRRLALSLLSMPFYWLLISAGGWLALWQLVVAPSHWNKTEHGLTRVKARPMPRHSAQPAPASYTAARV